MQNEQQPIPHVQFQKLREEVVAQTDRDFEKRAEENPTPTDLEVRIGTFIEGLESQVRNAVITMAEKGYSTESSGFYGVHGEIQQIDGNFSIDTETKKALSTLGAYVKNAKELGFPGLGTAYSGIGFYPATPDLKDITETWDRIVTALPQKDPTSTVSVSGASADFRTKYAHDRPDIELLALKKNIAEGPDQWDTETWKELNTRYQELSDLL